MPGWTEIIVFVQGESHMYNNVQQGEIGSLHWTHPEGAVGSVWTHQGIRLNLQSPWLSLTESLANIWSWSPRCVRQPLILLSEASPSETAKRRSCRSTKKN